MNENIFRIFSAVILLSAITISGYFRHKADRESGEKVSMKDEGRPIFLALRLGGLLLWFSPLIYTIVPAWMAWSKMGLPGWVRWIGIGIGVASLGLITWMFKSIGTGISPTVATRREHKLSTSGPYRWIRHPLYTFGTLAFLSLGLIADSWFMVLLSILGFILLDVRTPNEETHLIKKFGDEYREYMKRTGRYLPRLKF
ncbi:MAG: isoprenylcysteine carboxylmethyltransferase family protein [Chloroflexi bacterium]|nr:isoprenylcysteine carboxylmethyltransferase family protein [Chloroflexota bacterium]